MNLTDYMQGSRKGKAAHRIEREAMRDAFLSEALEGFETVTGDHAEAIRRMQQQIADRSQSKGRSVMFWFSMAASIALVIGFGWYLYFKFEVSGLKLYDTHLSEAISEDSLKRNETIAIAEPTAKPDVNEAVVQEKAVSRKVLPSPPPAVHAKADLEIVSDDVRTVVEKVKEDKEVDTRRVQGRVVDETGEPLPGVSIIVKNTAKGTTTDVNGEFALNTDDKTILQASFVGYEMKEIAADTSKMLIAMNESAAQLEEVVVVAFGTQRKSSAVSSVSAEPMRKIVPEPVIGHRAYQKYIRKNVVQPVDGACARVKGKVQVQFNVDAQGRPYNFQITGKLCDDADREAIRLIAEGCGWTQGNAEVTVTVEFR